MQPICPKCQIQDFVIHKLMLIGKASPEKIYNGNVKTGYRRLDQLAIDEVKENHLNKPPLQQFLNGFYCQKCGVGFVNDNVRKTV